MRRPRKDKQTLGLFGTITALRPGLLGAPSKVPHGTSAYYVVDLDGRPWVRKLVADIRPNGLLAEAVSYLLGHEIGVPVPRAATMGNGAEVAWLSELKQQARHWNPSKAYLVRDRKALGRVLALDAIIANEDRHEENLLLQATDGVELEVWAIDHADAGVAYPDEFAKRGLAPPQPSEVMRSLDLKIAAKPARDAARKASLISGTSLRRHAREACSLAGMSAKEDLLFDALDRRLKNAPQIVDQYLKAIGSRK